MKFQLLKQPLVGIDVPPVVFDNLYTARENDLKVILYVLQKGEVNVAEISRDLQISITAINSSLLFWTDKGLLLCEEENIPAKKKPPRLTSRQILEIAQSNPEIEFLVSRLQKIYGSAINENGTNAYLNLHLIENIPVDVILILAMHYAPIGKGPAYTARVIENLYNKKSITSREKAEEHIRTMLRRDEMYSKVCDIFSLDKAKLTTGEKTMIDSWSEKLDMSAEMINAAFSAAGPNNSLKYCNGILKSWSQKKYRTPADIQQEFAYKNLTGKNIDRQDDLILQGMNIVPVFDKGE